MSEVAQSSLTLCDPVDCSLPSVSRQEYGSGLPFPSPRDRPWSGVPFPSPGDLPEPGLEPRSPALQGVFTVWATRDSQLIVQQKTRSRGLCAVELVLHGQREGSLGLLFIFCVVLHGKLSIKT